MDVASFDDIAGEFHERVSRIVWCTVATIDRAGRPRSRILHPMWEGSTGWIMTGRHSHKARHLAMHPYVSLTYWDAKQEEVHVAARASWEDDPATKQRIWTLFETTSEPYGYNPALFFKAPDDPGFGVLKLVPWRVEISGLAGMMKGQLPKVWRQKA